MYNIYFRNYFKYIYIYLKIFNFIYFTYYLFWIENHLD